jgi:hypothetical protein
MTGSEIEPGLLQAKSAGNLLLTMIIMMSRILWCLVLHKDKGKVVPVLN